MDTNLYKDEIFRTYKIDYLGKYKFYDDEEEFLKRKDGEYILNNLKESKRFDYDGCSFTFTKYGNISEGVTEKDVSITIEKDNINVIMNNEKVHLDLIYKMQVKELEDHFRIATRISEVGDSVSCLIYINLTDQKDFIKALEYIRGLQKEFAKPK
ncbi:hypothetical protein [Clostridium sp.]|uniref:hypothetical protein n=1 Tax=Clostridium sp. TaxID=1506 RepID=UPI003F371E5E